MSHSKSLHIGNTHWVAHYDSDLSSAGHIEFVRTNSDGKKSLHVPVALVKEIVRAYLADRAVSRITEEIENASLEELARKTGGV